MYILKIALGFLALVAAWAYIFHNKLIFRLNAWMRDYVFSDRLVLFSGRRVAALLLILGGLALFSGLEGIIHVEPIRPNIAAQMLEQARRDFRAKHYAQVVNRCRELVRANPDSVDAWELLVTTWWAMGEKNMARQGADALLRLNPNHALGKSIFQAEEEKMRKERE